MTWDMNAKIAEVSGRIVILILAARGYSDEELAEYLGVHVTIVREIKKRGGR